MKTLTAKEFYEEEQDKFIDAYKHRYGKTPTNDALCYILAEEYENYLSSIQEQKEADWLEEKLQ